MPNLRSAATIPLGLVLFMSGCTGPVAAIDASDAGSSEGSGGPASGTTAPGETDDATDATDATSPSASATGTGEATSAPTTSASNGSEAGSEGSSSGGGGPDFGPWCEAPAWCDFAAPPPGPVLDWEHLDTPAVVLAGAANHRIRDMLYVPGETQWLMGKFAYGTIDKDLKDERVDVYVSRDCGGDWELLGQARTTEEGAHPTVAGVADTGGWVFFELPAALELDLGRHRVHMVVRGDQSTTDGFIEIVEPGTEVFVSDVDGTLTTSEAQEFYDLLTGDVPMPNPWSPEALSALQDKGYHAVYLTARPEWLVQRTRDFVQFRGYPPGVVHTSLNFDGALGAAAEAYKTAELQQLIDKGLVVSYAFGNKDSDSVAYENAGIMPVDHRVFFQHDDTRGGRRIENYVELVGEFEAMDDLCD